MKAKKEVLDFIREESDCSNSIISADNSSGIDIRIWDEPSINELSEMEFEGKVNPMDDIVSCSNYTPDMDVFQFSKDSYILQIATYEL